MVDYKYKDLFFKPHTDKKLLITSDDGSIRLTNSDLHSENFELNESICSESELKFGSCEASSLKFRISNVFTPMKDKWLTVTETLAGNTDAPFQYGKYKVFSDTPTADRRYRDITAYDAMYDIINSSAISWYNTILPKKNSKVTLKQFRTSFATYFGLEQEEITLANDDMIVEKTIEVEESVEIDNETEQTSIISESVLSGLDVLRAICEINGCFGHIGRDGKLHYIYIKQDIQGLYPAKFLFPNHVPEQWDYLPQAETGRLYPQSPKSERYGTGKYISCSYEDFVCRKINKIQIREKENDIGAQYPKEKVENQNAYIIEDNFLVYGKSTEDLEKIAKNIYEKVKNIVYRPFNAECVGNPCLEVGDAVRFSTKYELVESYILNRTLKGIQSPRDSFSAEGEEYRSENVNSISSSILQLKGKTNTLTRTVEETKSTIKDVESGLQTQITQNAESITLEAERAKESEKLINGNLTTKTEELSSKIEVTATNITQSVDAKITETKEYADGKVKESETQLSSKIDQTATNITSTVSATYETKTDATQKNSQLSSKIDQTATSITSTVSATYETKTDAGTRQQSLQSQITQNAGNIELRVEKTDYTGKTIASKINQSADTVKIDAEHLELNGNTKITGGYMHIVADESTDSIIELKTSGTIVQMGTDGMNSKAGAREAYFQYSNISVYNKSYSGEAETGSKKQVSNVSVVAQLLDTGRGVSSYGWDSYSDRRLKHNIKKLDIKKSAKFVDSMRPCEFIYDYDVDGRIRHGFIAQEALRKSYDKNWAICGKAENSGKKYLTMNYSELIADIVAALQYQSKQNKKNQEIIEKQEKQIKEMRKEINALKKAVSMLSERM